MRLNKENGTHIRVTWRQPGANPTGTSFIVYDVPPANDTALLTLFIPLAEIAAKREFMPSVKPLSYQIKVGESKMVSVYSTLNPQAFVAAFKEQIANY